MKNLVMGRRAISAIVATVLIILITVAGVAIIWVAVVPMITEKASFHDPNLRLDIIDSEGYTVYDSDLGLASVQVKRGVDEADLLGFDLIFDIDGESVKHFVNSTQLPEPNEARVYYVNLSNYSAAPTGIRVAPVFTDGEVGNVISEFKMKMREGNLETIKQNNPGVFSKPNGGYSGGGGGPSPGGPEVPTSQECSITNATWSKNSANESEIVNLIVRGENCIGEVSFIVYEDDGIGGNDGVSVQPANVTFVSGVAMSIWISEYQPDGLFGINDPPEYYFIATLSGNSSEEVDSRDYGNLLEVNKLVQILCGNGIIDAGEVCDGVNLSGQSCVIRGYDFGNLGCLGSCLGFNVSGCGNNPPSGTNAIIINSSHVELFDDIPDYYINKVKSDRFLLQWVGQSHGYQLPNGLQILENQDSRYSVQIDTALENLNENNALRVLRGQRSSSGTWTGSNGEESYWSTENGRLNTERTAYHSINVSDPIAISVWAWCWDIGGDSTNSNRVHDEDGTLADISFNDTHFNSYKNAISRFNNNGTINQVKFVYHTSVTDGSNEVTSGPNPVRADSAWRTTSYNNLIRQEAITNGGILFDQADIENWNYDNTQQRITTDYLGRTVYLRHADYNEGGIKFGLNDSYTNEHSHDILDLRKAKAQWVLAAMLAGWDGTVAPTPDCSEGLITTLCDCGGTDYGSGYCCSGTYQTTECGLMGFSESFDNGNNIFENKGVSINGNAGLVGGPDYNSDLNLVSIYEFDDILNLGEDAKNANNMGTVYAGAPTLGNDPEQSAQVPSGFSGYSLNLDGGNDTVCKASGNTFNPSQGHTSCFWIRPATSSRADGFAQVSNYDTWINSPVSGAYRWATRNGTAWINLDAAAALGIGRWTHICNKYVPSTLTKTIYINGTQSSSQTVSAMVSSASRWCLGSYGTSAFFNGLIYQPVWFNKSLSDGEVSNLYANNYFSSGAKTGNITSTVLSGSDNVVEITSVSWTESGTDTDNTIRVRVSVDDVNWYGVSNGQGLPQGGFVLGNQLRYRVLFDSLNKAISIDNVVIEWKV